jgi:hypothetical protein
VHHCTALSAYPPGAPQAELIRADQPGLFGLSTRKVYHASAVTSEAVGSYPAFSPFPILKNQNR